MLVHAGRRTVWVMLLVVRLLAKGLRESAGPRRGGDPGGAMEEVLQAPQPIFTLLYIVSS